MKTREKGQIVIILYRAFHLDVFLHFIKQIMKIILLLKPDLMVASACLCSEQFGNDSLQKMTIIHHEN